MIEPNIVDGKKLALIAWAKDAKGADDVSVFTGIAKWTGANLVLDRGEGIPSFTIPEDWVERLQSVNEELKETLLGSDYSISVSVGNIETENVSDYIFTGLKWPTKQN